MTQPQVFEARLARIPRYEHKRGLSPYNHPVRPPRSREARPSAFPIDGVFKSRFKFVTVLDNRRRGWTTPTETTTVPVAPHWHDGYYPRFLSAAWPYYIRSAISTSVGFLILAALRLAGDNKEKREKGKVKTE
jgi:hypothetical protein